ncbi:hypothetical protein SH1V18_43130 [Vallitalea longa]|uniref:YdbS-like PH domain-containing protein n=1 Tax=Vallitalea longa TaxID=2936439 RepID=A0A9W6DHU9_9FIRM|nr:hypothetical protein SH1V18_43130 [Vallitalea longa]
MTNIERNHPLYILKQAINGILTQIVFIIIAFTYLNKHIGTFFSALIIATFIILYIVYSVLAWYKTTFYFSENSIFYQKGILNINKREVPIERITTIDTSQGLFERIFNLSNIKVDTENVKAEKSEIKLTLSKEKAMILKQKLLDKDIEKSTEETSEYNLYKLSLKDLILYSIVSNSIFQGIIVIFAIYNYLDDIRDITSFDSLEYINQFKFEGYVIAVLILSAVLISLIISFIKNCIKYSYYTVGVENNKINISHGLISKKNYCFDKDKVKGIHIKQKLIMQLFHVSTIEIESIGYGDEKGERAVLYPFCSNKLRDRIIDDIVPEFNYDGNVNHASKNSYIRFIFMRLLITVIIAGIATYNINYGFISIILVGIALLLGHMEYKNTGIGMSDDLVYLSYKGFRKKQSIVKISSIQTLTMSHNYFQKNKCICNYTINIWGAILGKNITVKNIRNNLFESYVDKL